MWCDWNKCCTLLIVKQDGPKDQLLLAGDTFGSALVTHTRCLTMLEVI